MCEIYDVTKVDRGNGNFVKTDNSNNKKTLLKWWDKAMQFIGLKHAASVSSDNDKNNVDNENLQKDNMPKNDNFVLKFLKIKQVKILVIVLIISVLALIILNNSAGLNLGENSKSVSSGNGYMTGLEYCEKIEQKLMEVLGNINGVGDINVMVTVEAGPEIKIATKTDEKTTSTTNGSNITTNSSNTSNPVIIANSGKNNPLILSEISPKITGVVVVASGAKDVKVRLNLLEAVEALLNVPTENIQIYY